MKTALFYTSSTGNTALACRYIAQKVNNTQIDLLDIFKDESVDVSSYDVVGFAAPTQFMGVPYRFSDFIDRLPRQTDKPAFVFNTYGMMSGQTLTRLAQRVTAKGFKVIAGHSLLTPENYPPFIVKGWGNADAPDAKELAAFEQFIARLAGQLDALQAGQPVTRAGIKIGLLNSLMPTKSPAKARQDIGPLNIDETLCNGCGTCAESCPYHAIEFAAKPIFKTEQCHGCWRCFNRCPQQAIFTQKIRGTGHYPHPNAQLAAKLTQEESPQIHPDSHR